MNTLKNHTLIYDSNCPLCVSYSGAFIKTKMLDENGRTEYHKNNTQLTNAINMEKARNQIALLNTENGAVSYGIDSLNKIIGNAYPLLSPVLNWKPLHYFLSKFYSFISYNRKVIMPSANNENGCKPDFSTKYRLTFILFAWLITSFTLYNYSSLLTEYIPNSSFMREFWICGGQILFQGLFILKLKKQKAINYLGNMMTISLAGALALIPLGLIAIYTNSSLIALLSFLLVAGFMLLEHLRRINILKLPKHLTATWVLYRVLILLTILFI